MTNVYIIENSDVGQSCAIQLLGSEYFAPKAVHEALETELKRGRNVLVVSDNSSGLQDKVNIYLEANGTGGCRYRGCNNARNAFGYIREEFPDAIFMDRSLCDGPLILDRAANPRGFNVLEFPAEKRPA
ncbi:MAG: hypothetical protein J4400_02440 [Candidatus Aenigmarchaeota archaeon]|nr:hypothetical protein [Candidatus Aenigmarchaeota archaeon]